MPSCELVISVRQKGVVFRLVLCEDGIPGIVVCNYLRVKKVRQRENFQSFRCVVIVFKSLKDCLTLRLCGRGKQQRRPLEEKISSKLVKTVVMLRGEVSQQGNLSCLHCCTWTVSVKRVVRVAKEDQPVFSLIKNCAHRELSESCVSDWVSTNGGFPAVCLILLIFLTYC